MKLDVAQHAVHLAAHHSRAVSSGLIEAPRNPPSFCDGRLLGISCSQPGCCRRVLILVSPDPRTCRERQIFECRRVRPEHRDRRATVSATSHGRPGACTGSTSPVLPHTAPTAAVRPGRPHVPDWAQAPRVPACAAGNGGQPHVGHLPVPVRPPALATVSRSAPPMSTSDPPRADPCRATRCRHDWPPRRIA